MANKENMLKFVEALESGEFKQTKGVLRKDDCHCALGVACELYARSTGKAKWGKDDDNSTYEFKTDHWSLSYTVPPVIWKFLGLSGFEVDEIVEMNDGKEDQKTFSEIAKVLRDKYLTEEV
jgi:hypothetical protein